MPKRLNQVDQNQDGMTLIEMLAALTLTAVMVLMLTDALAKGMSVWDRAQSHEEHISSMVASTNLIKRYLGQLTPTTRPSASSQAPEVIVDGKPTRLAFKSMAAPHLGAGLRDVALFVESDAGVNKLMMSWAEIAPNQSVASVIRHPNHLVLAEGIKGVKFSYYGHNERIKEWTPNWSEKTELPRLISMEVTFTSDRQKWPRIVVTPMMNFESGCVYSSSDGRCTKLVEAGQ